MVWWKKTAAFTTADLAILGLIGGYFGAYLTVGQKILVLSVGLGLIPFAIVISWTSNRATAHKASQARAKAVVEGLRRIPEEERVSFRNQLFKELVSILDQLRSPIEVTYVISYSVWNSKSQGETIKLLGADDFAVLDAFYRRVYNRNRYYDQAGIPTSHDELETSRLVFIEEIRRLFESLPWLKFRKADVNWPPTS